MKTWAVNLGTVRPPEQGGVNVYCDQGQKAYRPKYCRNGLYGLIPVPCVRRQDCERVVEFLNQHYQYEGVEDMKTLAATMIADWEQMRKEIGENCFAW